MPDIRLFKSSDDWIVDANHLAECDDKQMFLVFKDVEDAKKKAIELIERLNDVGCAYTASSDR